MSTVLEHAYHESGHALVARALGRPLEMISVSIEGGLTRTSEPAAAARTDEELERTATIILAGEVAQRYAPRVPLDAPSSAQNGHMELDAFTAGLIATAEGADGPLDSDALEQIRQKIGDEALERSRTLATELIERQAVLGYLERVADQLLLYGVLTGDDLETLLAPARA